jgi:hypothetical protein
LKLLARLRKLSAFLWTSFLALVQKIERKEGCAVSDLEILLALRSLSPEKQALVIKLMEKVVFYQAKGKRKEDAQDE